jgi:hypothetical protein
MSFTIYKHEHGVRTDKEVGGKDGKNTFE